MFFNRFIFVLLVGLALSGQIKADQNQSFLLESNHLNKVCFIPSAGAKQGRQLNLGPICPIPLPQAYQAEERLYCFKKIDKSFCVPENEAGEAGFFIDKNFLSCSSEGSSNKVSSNSLLFSLLCLSGSNLCRVSLDGDPICPIPLPQAYQIGD